MQDRMRALADDAADRSEPPMFDHAIRAEHDAVGIEEAHHRGEGVHGEFPLMLRLFDRGKALMIGRRFRRRGQDFSVVVKTSAMWSIRGPRSRAGRAPEADARFI